MGNNYRLILVVIIVSIICINFTLGQDLEKSNGSNFFNSPFNLILALIFFFIAFHVTAKLIIHKRDIRYFFYGVIERLQNKKLSQVAPRIKYNLQINSMPLDYRPGDIQKVMSVILEISMFAGFIENKISKRLPPSFIEPDVKEAFIQIRTLIKYIISQKSNGKSDDQILDWLTKKEWEKDNIKKIFILASTGSIDTEESSEMSPDRNLQINSMPA